MLSVTYRVFIECMDNSVALAVKQADHAGALKTTKHHKRCQYYLRECQLDGSNKAHFVRTCDQVADRFTKVSRQEHVFKLRQHASILMRMECKTNSSCLQKQKLRNLA
eukprot:1883580-Pleurochrysis_carterae.AAC.1